MITLILASGNKCCWQRLWGLKMPEDSLMTLLFKLKAGCQQKEEAIRTSAGISEAAYHCLAVLEAGEQLSLGDVARRLKLSSSRASRVVDGLMRKGLLVRRIDPEDRRAARIALTDEGQQVHQQIFAAMLECEESLCSHFEAEELAVLKKGLHTLVDVL